MVPLVQCSATNTQYCFKGKPIGNVQIENLCDFSGKPSHRSEKGISAAHYGAGYSG